jgi:hypothetical protein
VIAALPPLWHLQWKQGKVRHVNNDRTIYRFFLQDKRLATSHFLIDIFRLYNPNNDYYSKLAAI